MSDWESDEETPFLWDQFGIELGIKSPRKWNIYPWEENLSVVNKKNQIIQFDENYNLPEQKVIRNDIKPLIKKLKISDDEKEMLMSNLELLVTFYRKSTKQPYKTNNGWLELILPFLLMKLPPKTVYNLFEAIIKRFILKNENYGGILSLLFLYHDPELAIFLQFKQISYDKFSKKWIKTLFADTCNLRTILVIWKHYFNLEGRQQDPLLIFYLILTILIHHRKLILSMEDTSTETLTQVISNLPRDLDAKQAQLICNIAENYKLKTPVSYEEEYLQILFSSSLTAPQPHELTCMEILPSELLIELDAVFSNQPLQLIKYLVIDCRPASQFNAGHLPTAINLDYTLHFTDPSAYANKIDKLVNKRPELPQTPSVAEESKTVEETETKKFGASIHFCFMGSGNEEDDMYFTTTVASIIQIHVKYVSILKGGYKAVHDCYEDEISCKLEDHNRKRCLICRPPVKKHEREPARPLSRGKKLWHQAMAPIATCMKTNRPREEDDDGDGNTGYSLGTVKCYEDKLMFEIVSVTDYKKKFDILYEYKCHEVNQNSGEEYESELYITKNQIILLRLVNGHPHVAYITAIHPVSTLMRITTAKTDMNVINLQYGEQLMDGSKIILRIHALRISNRDSVVGALSKIVLKSMAKSKRRHNR